MIYITDRQQASLAAAPLTDEQVDFIWDCDWEDEICPVCGHRMDYHDSRTMTRCVNASG